MVSEQLQTAIGAKLADERQPPPAITGLSLWKWIFLLHRSEHRSERQGDNVPDFAEREGHMSGIFIR